MLGLHAPAEELHRLEEGWAALLAGLVVAARHALPTAPESHSQPPLIAPLLLQLPLRVKVEEDLGVGRGPPHLWAREEAIELRAQRLLDLRITPPQLADERPDARAIHHFVMPPQAGAGT